MSSPITSTRSFEAFLAKIFLFAVVLAVMLVSERWLGGQVVTSQYDNARTGADLTETKLTPSNVNPHGFGKVFTLKVDADVYAQPLYLPHLELPSQGVHNVVFVATEHDSVYAFDADAPAAPLWQASFVNPSAGITPVPARDVRCPFIRPEVGITSTPVIDPETGTIYVLARTKTGSGIWGGKYAQHLHALDVKTGTEKFGGPVEVRASVTGTKYLLLHGAIDFDPQYENPRSGLALTNGKLYLTWASSCDVQPYYGWVMAYDAHSLAQLGVFNTAPDGQESGIWQGDTAPAADSEGDLYVVTGNGSFNAATGGHDYGDSVVKLNFAGKSLLASDYFTPHDQEQLNAHDKDLGSGGPMLLPDQPGPHPHLLVVTGKGGTVYVIDRDKMGKFHAGDDSHAVQAIHAAPEEVFGAPAYWNGFVYYLFSMDSLKAFALDHGQLDPHPVAKADSASAFIDPGSTPTISANGAQNGIVWALKSVTFMGRDEPAVLHAYDAVPRGGVLRELYNSERNSARDRVGIALRFNIPTVANGHVYVGAKREVDVYGLLLAGGQAKRSPAKRGRTR